MYESLLATIAGDISLTAEQVAFIKSLFVPRALRKGQFFQRAGEVAAHGGFVVCGCFRTYVIDADGNEGIVHFSPERAWIGDIDSATAQTPTIYFVDAIEPSDVLVIDLPSFERLLEAIPAIAHGYRMGLQRSRAAMERRLALSRHWSAAERYAEFLKRHPSLALRVPQRMLASYLGMTPETLSRIRRNEKGPRAGRSIS